MHCFEGLESNQTAFNNKQASSKGMDCGLIAAGLKQMCVAPLRPSKLDKKKSSKKIGELDVEHKREWPVDPKQYELLHRAGKGAHAAVYCGRCKPYDEVIAVKKLDLDASCNYDLTSLIREATLMRKLQHPNVLQLHTSFVVGRELWLVMPYMAHGSVRSIMKKQGLTQGLDEVVIASIMRSVLQGLDYVHQNGGIHRDIKADNILISEDGEVRLADFGVAAARTRQVSMINLDMSAVMATTFVGTPCWMAPEVMAQDDGYNTSADIWSVGITMIELAQGRPPLSRAHPMRVLMDTMHNPPPSLDDHFSKCFKEVVDACLCKDPSERPSAVELLNFRFFRMAREPEFLVEHFLTGLEVHCQARTTAAACPDGTAAQDAAAAGRAGCAANGVSSRAPIGLQPPQLLGGILRGKSALGLQELVVGRIGSRLHSSWYFPPMQQLLQAHQEDGQEEDQATTDEATAEQAAAATAGQAAGAVLAGVVSRDGSRLAKGDAAAAGAAIMCGACASSGQHSSCKNEQGASDQQLEQQQQQQNISSCSCRLEGASSCVVVPAVASAVRRLPSVSLRQLAGLLPLLLPSLDQQQEGQQVTEQQADCAEPSLEHSGTAAKGQDYVGAEDEEITCVEVQVLLAGTAAGKQQLQEHSLSNEQVSC